MFGMGKKEKQEQQTIAEVQKVLQAGGAELSEEDIRRIVAAQAAEDPAIDTGVGEDAEAAIAASVETEDPAATEAAITIEAATFAAGCVCKTAEAEDAESESGKPVTVDVAVFDEITDDFTGWKRISITGCSDPAGYHAALDDAFNGEDGTLVCTDPRIGTPWLRTAKPAIEIPPFVEMDEKAAAAAIQEMEDAKAAEDAEAACSGEESEAVFTEQQEQRVVQIVKETIVQAMVDQVVK